MQALTDAVAGADLSAVIAAAETLQQSLQVDSPLAVLAMAAIGDGDERSDATAKTERQVAMATRTEEQVPTVAA